MLGIQRVQRPSETNIFEAIQNVAPLPPLAPPPPVPAGPGTLLAIPELGSAEESAADLARRLVGEILPKREAGIPIGGDPKRQRPRHERKPRWKTRTFVGFYMWRTPFRLLLTTLRLQQVQVWGDFDLDLHA